MKSLGSVEGHASESRRLPERSDQQPWTSYGAQRLRASRRAESGVQNAEPVSSPAPAVCVSEIGGDPV